MDACDEKKAKPVTDEIPLRKRAYAKPELIEFGDIRALTLGPGVGSHVDLKTGTRRP